MIWLAVIIIGLFYLLSTSGVKVETSVLGLDTPVITAQPAEKAPESNFQPAPRNEISGSYEQPVSTFLERKKKLAYPDYV